MSSPYSETTRHLHQQQKRRWIPEGKECDGERPHELAHAPSLDIYSLSPNINYFLSKLINFVKRVPRHTPMEIICRGREEDDLHFKLKLDAEIERITNSALCISREIPSEHYFLYVLGVDC